MISLASLRVHIVCAVIAMLCAPSWAADAKGSFVVLSLGTKSCGTVAEEYEKNDRGKLSSSIWVGGYLTAINAEVHNGTNVAQGTDPAARDLWIYNYCKTEPLDTLYDATAALVKELKKRAR